MISESLITPISIIAVTALAFLGPFLIGELVCCLCGDKRGVIYKDIAYGFMVMFVVFQILAVPMILLRTPFHVLVNIWTVIIVILCMVSLFLIVRDKNYKNNRSERRNILSKIWEDRFTGVVWASTLLVILFETCLLTVKMHVDTDDARFVAEAIEAVEDDTMLLHHPITGQYFGVATGEQRKDITAPYPIYIGLFSSLSGIHPAICAHTVFPLIFIPLSYLVFAMIGDWIFKDDIQKKGLFLLFLSLIHLFSFETIYSSGYTLLTIIWQGRSVASMIMLPLLWYTLLRISDRDIIKVGDYVLVVLATLANAMLSNMAALFALIMSLSYMAVIIFRRKSVKVMMCCLLSILPVVAIIVFGRLLTGTNILNRGLGVVRII